MENVIEKDVDFTPRLDALHALCAGRHSTRTFAERPVPPELIARILDVARTAPYASGKKNWEVIVVADEKIRTSMTEIVRRKASALLAEIRSDFRSEFAAYAEHFTAFASAPVILVPTFRIAPSLSLMRSQSRDGDDAAAADLRQWEHDNYVKSISCVCMLMLLAAEAAGLGACYMTGPLLAEGELAAAIGAKPGRNLAGLIPIGYRKQT